MMDNREEPFRRVVDESTIYIELQQL